MSIAADAVAKYEKQQSLLKDRDTLEQKIADLKTQSEALHQSQRSEERRVGKECRL